VIAYNAIFIEYTEKSTDLTQVTGNLYQKSTDLTQVTGNLYQKSTDLMQVTSKIYHIMLSAYHQ
jgi:uncharacterized membrane protein YoaK (UPF0700 family)